MDPQELIAQLLNGEIDPEEGDPYQVAGPVIPLRTHPPSIADVLMRLQTPGVAARSKGMQTIERFGTNPHTIDLMDVLTQLGQPVQK